MQLALAGDGAYSAIHRCSALLDGEAPWPNVPADLAGVNACYHAYARRPEPLLGMPCDVITPLIFIFVRASVHYAMFEDEYYLKSQMKLLKQGVFLLGSQYREKKQE